MLSLTVEAAVLGGAGVFAGIVSAVVGNGTLIGYPVMRFCGLPPLTANMSTAIGLVPGSVTAALGYRPELRGQAGRVRQLGILAALGSLLGALLLLTLPPVVFSAAAPLLIGIAVVACVLQPWLKRRVDHYHQHKTADREQAHAGVRADLRVGARVGRPEDLGDTGPDHAAPASSAADAPRRPGLMLSLGTTLIGVYTGYFGGGAGLAFYAALAIALPEPLKRSNAVKVVLVLVSNMVASAVFILGAHRTGAHIAWIPALALAAGAMVGGWLGSKIGRVLPDMALRVAIFLVGTAAVVSSIA
jgi:uncharacterized membrane protein YfcA